MPCDYILGEYAGVRSDSCVFHIYQCMQKNCRWQAFAWHLFDKSEFAGVNTQI